MSVNKIALVVVVNGEETALEANLNAPLRTVAQHALNQSGHSGRPLEDWELRDASGRILEFDRKVGEAGLAPGAILYLSLRVGANGTWVSLGCAA